MATDFNIEVFVRARWITDVPAYRLWVDNELICERSFWPNPENFFIRENFVVEITPGRHELKLEQIDPSYGTVTMHKVNITNLETELASTHKLAPNEFSKFQALTFNA